MATAAARAQPQVPRTPARGEIALAVFAALAGAALAIASLVLKPVAITAGAPGQFAPASGASGTGGTGGADAGARVVHYTHGSRDRAKVASWARKRSALLAAVSGKITLTEDDLNLWFATGASAPAPARPAPDAAFSASAGDLDFRIAGGLLQIAAPVAVQTPLGSRQIIVQMRGSFARVPADSGSVAAGLVMYAPSEAYAGSLPLHRIPGAIECLLEKILESQVPPGAVLDIWKNIERVVIDGRELVVIFSPGAPGN